jgi:hypothetical protein
VIYGQSKTRRRKILLDNFDRSSPGRT